MAQKSNSRYAPQPYTNQSVFKSLLNCTSEISLSRNAAGRSFQRRGPATENSYFRDTFVFFLWHTSTHQPISVIGGRCRSRADNVFISASDYHCSLNYSVAEVHMCVNSLRKIVKKSRCCLDRNAHIHVLYISSLQSMQH